MRKLFLLLLMTLAVSFTTNQLLYTNEESSPSTIDEGWLLEDGVEGINIYPYEQGTHQVYFPYDVIIMSDSDGRYVFSLIVWQEEEISFWTEKYKSEINKRNEDIRDYNNLIDNRDMWKDVVIFGIPSAIAIGLIGGLLL